MNYRRRVGRCVGLAYRECRRCSRTELPTWSVKINRMFGFFAILTSVFSWQSLRRHREPCASFVLRRKGIERRLADIHHHATDCTRECKRGLIQVRNRRTSVATDIETLIGSKKTADLLLETTFADGFL